MPRAPRPTEVAELLTRLREAAGLSTTEVGTRVGLAQTTISHIEHARLVPDRPQMEALLDTYRPDSDTRTRLLERARDPAQRRRTVLHRADAPRYQSEYRELEQRSARLRSFTATIVPGIAQTEDYTRAVVGQELTGTQRDRWLAQRAQRRALLDDPERRVEFVIHSAALAVNRGGVDAMTEQVTHLAELSRREHIALGVIGAGVDVGAATVLNNIDYYDLADGGRRVIIGTSEGTAIIEEAASVELHVAILDRLGGLARWGDEARAVLEDVARQYRS